MVFPVFLKLTGRRVLVVGGGVVATSKVAALQAAGADVVVVAPKISPALEASGVSLVRRRFRASDVRGAWFVVSTAPPEVNRAVAAATSPRSVFVNAVDDPAHADAYLGGVVRRGGVTIAISTDGEAPALAGLIREGLDQMLPADLRRWTNTARRLKTRQRRAGTAMAERRPSLLMALNQLYAKRPARPA